MKRHIENIGHRMSNDMHQFGHTLYSLWLRYYTTACGLFAKDTVENKEIHREKKSEKINDPLDIIQARLYEITARLATICSVAWFMVWLNIEIYT